MAAVPASMRVFDTEQLEIFFPVRAFFIERGGAETSFNPISCTVASKPRVLHVVQVFIAGNRALSKGALINRVEQRLFLPGF